MSKRLAIQVSIEEKLLEDLQQNVQGQRLSDTGDAQRIRDRHDGSIDGIDVTIPTDNLDESGQLNVSSAEYIEYLLWASTKMRR